MSAYDFDVIVVGSGAGGGTFAYRCAQAGRSVLLLERGPKYVLPHPVHDEHAMLIEKRPYDDRPIAVNGVARRLFIGGLLGGGTALYGAALLRPSSDDFHPGKHYGRRIPRAIWDWPVGYNELAPFYAQAESLYGVAGDGDDEFGPLHEPRCDPARQLLPLEPINRRLMAVNRAHGLKPFRLPMAIDLSRCLQCQACPGYVCVNGARQSSGQLIERAAAQQMPVRVLTNTEVERFETGPGGEIAGVAVRDRATGEPAVYRARRYALAAGALASPALLLRSGLSHPLVGRNYMLHVSPIVIGLFREATGADTRFVKQVGFADYYFGTRRYSHKLGLVQSLPVPGPLMLGKSAPWLPTNAINGLRRRMLPLAGIVEDLPDPANRVSVGENGQIALNHRFGKYDLQRGRRLGRLMRGILKRAGAVLCIGKRFPSHEHVAHQCGTLRFGADPAEAVLDSDCRVFARPNLFVVDGSFFPTSLGVGPALTIMANALRVAEVVIKEV